MHEPYGHTNHNRNNYQMVRILFGFCFKQEQKIKHRISKPFITGTVTLKMGATINMIIGSPNIYMYSNIYNRNDSF